LEDNIKMDLKAVEYEVVNWTHLVQDRVQWLAVVYTVMELRVS
jgi:hypothetical protein